MADAALRTAPVPAEPAVFSGVTIALAAPLARYSLRARDPKVLAQAVGRKLPTKVGATEGEIACLGPDEWLLRTAPGSAVPLGEGLPVAVVDVSERSVTLVIEGDRAVEVLETGCPRNVSAMAVGETRRTVFEGVEVIVHRTAANRFEVDVWRSFSTWLHLALTKAASHL